jgi:hypothetical protein
MLNKRKRQESYNIRHCQFTSEPRVSSACYACKKIKQKCSDVHPCSRCVRIGRADTCSPIEPDTNFIERPMASRSHILFSSHQSFPKIELKSKWAFKIIYKIWAAGYQVQSLVNIFDSFSPSLAAVVSRSLSDLQERSNQKMLQLAQGSSSVGSFGKTGVIDECAAESTRMLAEAEMWEREEDYGFLQIVFDPNTQERRSLFMNTRFAALWGLHREEMLARFANFDVEIPRPELDSLRIFLDDFNHMVRPPRPIHA